MEEILCACCGEGRLEEVELLYTLLMEDNITRCVSTQGWRCSRCRNITGGEEALEAAMGDVDYVPQVIDQAVFAPGETPQGSSIFF